MNKIVIFGGTGQVGSSLLDILKNDYNIIAPTSSNVPLNDRLEITNFLCEHSPKAIINCAAYTDVENAELRPLDAFQINFYAVKEIVDYCYKNSIPLIHISTDYVFNGFSKKEYTEEDNTSPLNIYGWSKLAGEKAITEKLKNFAIIRTSWVFSPSGRNFISKISSLLLENKQIRVVGDQHGCPTSALSLAYVIKHILKLILINASFNPGIYHYCNYPPTTWFDLSKKLKHILMENNKNISCEIIKVSSEEFNTIAERPKFSVLSNEKLIKETGIDMTSWESEISKLYT